MQQQLWAYLRVSTRKEEQEDSLEEQQRRAEAFAAERGYALRPFIEQASAKSITGRPILTGLLSELEALPARQRPAGIYVTALDRLARDIADSMYVGRMLRALKVALHVHGRGEVRLETFAERAVFVGESLGGDAENEARSKRSRDSWDRRRRENKPTSNKVPYGMQLVGERDVPIPDSADWVRKAFEWYGAGEGTYVIGKRFAQHAPPHTWLTTRVGEDGNRISKTRVTRWESLRIAKLLRQRRYRGTIVEPELFDCVARRLANTPKPGSRREREYPLSGAMRCSGCGRHLHGRASGGSTTRRMADGSMKRYARERVRYYACVVCNYMLNAEKLEAAFFADVGELIGSESLLRTWISAPRIGSAESRDLRREAKKLEAELSNDVLNRLRDKMVDLVLSSRISDAEFERQSRRLQAEVDAKRVRLLEITTALSGDAAASRTLDQAQSLLKSFPTLYRRAPYERKRQLVEALVESLGGLCVSPEGLAFAKRPAKEKTRKR